MKPVPNRAPKLGRANQVMRNVASAELNQSMGKIGVGGNKSRAEKRNSTRADKKRNAIREDMS